MKIFDYPVSAAPHLRASVKASKIYGIKILALAPALIGLFIFFPLKGLRVFAAVLAGILAAEFLSVFLHKRKYRLRDGSSLWAGLLMIFLLPLSLPVWAVFLGVFFAIFFVKELFGGFGSYILSPALAGAAFLQLSFPESFSRAAPGPLFQIPGAGVWIFSVLFLLGGAIILFNHKTPWEIPFLYTGGVLLFAAVFPGEEPGLSMARILGAAFFFFEDPVTMPSVRSGRRLAVLLAALLTVIFYHETKFLFPEVFAVLLINMMTPWIDQWILPSGILRVK